MSSFPLQMSCHFSKFNVGTGPSTPLEADLSLLGLRPLRLLDLAFNHWSLENDSADVAELMQVPPPPINVHVSLKVLDDLNMY